MRFSLLFLLVALIGIPSGQAQQADSWHTVQRMCGQLSQRRLLPRKKATDPIRDKVDPLRHVRVSLYAHQENSLCCDAMQRAATAVTDDEGKFGFKKTPPGSYWFAFQLKGHIYSYPLLYKPNKHADPDCDSFALELDESHEPPLQRALIVE